MFDLPESALPYGFAKGPGGTHTSRTIMLDELRLLLAACPASAGYADYRRAVADDNAIRKDSYSGRVRSLRGLRELYGLDRNLVLFRALRDLWDADAQAQPLLAFCCAAARDPLLRQTADFLLALPCGQPATPQMFYKVIAEARPDHYSEKTLLSLGQNLASSWQQAGHLAGKRSKTRASAQCRPTAAAYALLLGYLCGGRGEALFDTLWVRLLDAPAHTLHDQAFLASQQGWLEYRQTGMVTEVAFQHLLRGADEFRTTKAKAHTKGTIDHGAH
jgi:hypothetical protein